uniref:ribosomal protein S2 n=1 Tax=Hydrocytium acuminatum TaxID=1745963 RepID=UPI002A826C06|nr:ribosomal protein S2 [Hydrocytium acuminatum]WOR09505.1 ribosomal protein S2 [Hydrocytium acuminatum]
MLMKSMHYGHSILKCHPKMRRFIRAKRNGRYLINLPQTYRYLVHSLWYLFKYAYKKKKFLFVGTTLSSSEAVATAAIKAKSYFVNVRWLGGTLSNWLTIKKRIRKLRNLSIKASAINKKLLSPSLGNNVESASKNEKILSKKQRLSKKEMTSRQKQFLRLEKYLTGIKRIRRLPQVVILASQNNSLNTALECQKLGVRLFSLVDTNCNPELADFIVPTNDDSASSVQYILSNFSHVIQMGRTLKNMKKLFKKTIKKNNKKKKLSIRQQKFSNQKKNKRFFFENKKKFYFSPNK